MRHFRSVLIVAVLAFASSLHAEQAAFIELWGTHLGGGKWRENPADPTALRVTFTRPDQSTTTIRGYWEGGDRWGWTFMPDQIGKWHYTAVFGDNEKTVSWHFECIPPQERDGAPRGMITRHAANPIWFGHAGGEAVLIRGLHVGDRFFATNWPDSEREAFLDWAQGNGYNLLSIASHYLNRDSAGRGKGWDTPDLWPIDPAQWDRVQRIVHDLGERGIMVFPFAGFFGRDSDFPRDPAQQEIYIRYAIARLGGYWNVVWNVGGPEPNLKGKSYLSDDEVNRLGRLIAQLDPHGHLLSVHNRTGIEPYRDSDWSTFGTVQGPKTVNRGELGRKLLEWHHPAKPLLAQETLWPGNKHHPPYTLDDIRKNAYVIHFSGASLVFGDMNGDSSSGFSGTMNLTDRVQARHDAVAAVWDFLATTSFAELTPRPDLVDRGHCLAAPAAGPGSHYMIYLPDGGSVNAKLEGGPYHVQWIDAKDTARRIDGEPTRDGRNLTAPAGGDDWILVLAAKPSK